MHLMNGCGDSTRFMFVSRGLAVCGGDGRREGHRPRSSSRPGVRLLTRGFFAEVPVAAGLPEAVVAFRAPKRNRDPRIAAPEPSRPVRSHHTPSQDTSGPILEGSRPPVPGGALGRQTPRESFPPASCPASPRLSHFKNPSFLPRRRGFRGHGDPRQFDLPPRFRRGHSGHHAASYGRLPAGRSPQQTPSAIRSIRCRVARASPRAVWSPPTSFWFL